MSETITKQKEKYGAALRWHADSLEIGADMTADLITRLIAALDADKPVIQQEASNGDT